MGCAFDELNREARVDIIISMLKKDVILIFFLKIQTTFLLAI
jgi:hypothetical protein